jgi:hypothetical protein
MLILLIHCLRALSWSIIYCRFSRTRPYIPNCGFRAECAFGRWIFTMDCAYIILPIQIETAVAMQRHLHVSKRYRNRPWHIQRHYCDPHRGLLLREPSVVALNFETNALLAVAKKRCAWWARPPEHPRRASYLRRRDFGLDVAQAMITAFIIRPARRALSSRASSSACQRNHGVESSAVISAALGAARAKCF